MSRRVAVTSVEISSVETNDIRCEIAVRNDMELLMYHYIILFFVKSLLPYDTTHVSRSQILHSHDPLTRAIHRVCDAMVLLLFITCVRAWYASKMRLRCPHGAQSVCTQLDPSNVTNKSPRRS
jgi:hypothetical protein